MAKITFQSKNRKQEIIQTARRMFNTQQYDNTSMQDIIDALGIAKGTIYHYFASKEALLEAVVENIIDENIEHIEALIRGTRRTALEKMKLLIEKGSISTENEDILTALHARGNELLHTRSLAVATIKLAPLYAKIITQGCKEGVFKTDNPLECAEFIIAGIQFLTDVGIYPWSAEDLKRRARAFPQLVEQQLGAPRGSFDFMSSIGQK